MKTLIRIKRRADEEPVENILVKPKRARFCEIGSAVARAPDVQPTVLERVATVESKVSFFYKIMYTLITGLGFAV